MAGTGEPHVVIPDPRFIVTVLSSNYDKLRIPPTFWENIVTIEGQNTDQARIRDRRGRLWLVRYVDYSFADGWSDFVDFHDLRWGETIEFKYRRGLAFSVRAYQVDGNEKAYPNPRNPDADEELTDPEPFAVDCTIWEIFYTYFNASAVNQGNLYNSKAAEQIYAAGITTDIEVTRTDPLGIKWNMTLWRCAKQSKKVELYLYGYWDAVVLANGLEVATTELEIMIIQRRPVDPICFFLIG